MSDKPGITRPFKRKQAITIPKVKNSPNVRLFQEKEGFRTRKQKEEEQKREEEERDKLEQEKASEPDLFKTLKKRRQEEEQCLDFLDLNRKELRAKNTKRIEEWLNDEFKNHLYKRIQLQAESERELKGGLKKNYENKKRVIGNRRERNEEYIEQRKKDFAISQRRVRLLLDKLKDEYLEEVQNVLNICNVYRDEISLGTTDLLNVIGSNSVNNVANSIIKLQEITDALSFVPFYYSDCVPLFNRAGMVFDYKEQEISDFQVELYKTKLLPETSRVLTTILEVFQPGVITPKLRNRKGRVISVLSKPLVFTKEQKIQFANEIGWKPLFVEDFGSPVEDIYELLSSSGDDFIVFDFPRTLAEMDAFYLLFNPHSIAKEKSYLLPRPIPSESMPFDSILELFLDDEIIIGEALAIMEDSQTSEKYDVRDIDVQDEKQIIQIHHVKDPLLDINQYPTRSVTLQINFQLISEQYPRLHQSMILNSRGVTNELIQNVNNYVTQIPSPLETTYPSETIIASLASQIDLLDPEIKKCILSQWEYIESTYTSTVNEVFKLINSSHLTMVEHLSSARKEMTAYLSRPGNSQQSIVEFQQWYCTQVERGMRRMPKVKEECNLRLSTLRDLLLQNETDRKANEEFKQKDLYNEQFGTSLLEIMSNAYTALAQAEIDRWTSTRVLMMDLNQIILSSDLVPPIQHRKLEQTDYKSDKKKQAKKPNKAATPTGKNRPEDKLQAFDNQLSTNIEAVKKYVTEVSCVYMPITAPPSTREKKRPVKDKNPLSVHRITAIDEFQSAFKEDDTYFIGQLDKIVQMAKDEISAIQTAFGTFIEDSTNWILTHFKIRKSIADTAIAYMKQKVDEEQQLNQLVLLSEDGCLVDFTQLLTPNEESPKIPPPFPEEIILESSEGKAEALFTKINRFQGENTSQ